ncbi:MAG: acetate non-utilizing protein 9 [Cirrosporium novae-zelandiae]|nr:MAG: acetate non-utilizing protein 9 [Cirrosporium novae-zelandiae]
MKVFSKLLMALPTNAGASSSILSPAPMALLPPIPLYRRVLRANRKKLTAEMRILGDSYVKDEFRKHRDVENPLYILGFLMQWQLYAQKLEGDSWRDSKLDPEVVNKMSDQQLGQLYELMQSIKNKDAGDK